jgi:hypothetical protein
MTGLPIEILGATYARSSMFEKRRFFPADLHPILRSEDRFCRPLKKCSFEVNYLA